MLNVSTYAMVVLLLFNDIAEDAHLTFEVCRVRANSLIKAVTE